ncbi:MAG TPA: hypothetical protein VLB00_05895 [Gemmatimonadales bacterium]|nr:hypothetical protein [Gemmatimonadales bacterium]
MAVTRPAPRTTVSRQIFSLALAERLRSIPFGGALGVVAAGTALWLAPEILPAGWSPQSFLAFGMGTGIVIDRLLAATIGWIVSPLLRHLSSRWEATLQLGKLERYQRRGTIGGADGKRIALRIAKSDVAGDKPPRS